MLLSTTLLAAMVAVASGATPAADRGRPLLVALGDSLTSGHGIGAARAFPAILQKRIDEEALGLNVVNAGISGDTTARAVQRYREALRGDVRVLIIALGANDGLRGVPVADLRRNLATIIEDAQSRGIAVLLCGMEALPIYGWNYSVAFHQAYVDLARTYNVPLVPFMMLNVLGDPGLMQPDRVHPNAEGARVMADHVWPYLEGLLKRTSYSRSAT
jgi:acyl-CoA thioesterase I